MKKLIIFCMISTMLVGYASTKQIEENCIKKDTKLCYETIESYRMNNSFDILNWDLIIKWYMVLCDESFVLACQKLGDIYSPTIVPLAPTVKTDREKSEMYYNKVYMIEHSIEKFADTSFLDKSCQGKNYDLCYKAIIEHRENNDYDKINWRYIEDLLIKMCNNNYAKACRFLGHLYAPNTIDMIKADWAKSGKYHTLGCKLNDINSCHSLGVMYELGIYYKKDYKKALELLTPACEDHDYFAVDKACQSKEDILKKLRDFSL